MRLFLVTFLLISIFSSKAQEIKINEQLEELVYETYDKMEVATPTALDPLAFNARLVWSRDKKQLALVLKAKLMNNWHIYAYTEEDSPFIMTQLEYFIQKEAVPITDWVKPEAIDYTDGIHVYEGELYFFRFFEWQGDVTMDEKIGKCSIFYQACDPYQCLPPNTKTVVFDPA